MQKLLHERLRDGIAEADDTGEAECRFCDVRGMHFIGIEFAKTLADEIERYYIPRPRFEDGEPVQDSNLEEIGAMATCCVFTDGSWRFDPDKYEDERNPKPWDKQEGRQYDRIKRPTPKVLDSDGVPYKNGDTVYDIEACQQGNTYWGRPLTVMSLSETHVTVYQDSPGTNITKPIDCFTHEKPVFDADGVRTCKGDTVWDLKNPNRKKLTVIDVIPDDDCIVCDDKLTYTPAYITHREPDSIENLRDDMKLIAEHYPDSMSTPEEWVKRLTTLIERGA